MLCGCSNAAKGLEMMLAVGLAPCPVPSSRPPPRLAVVPLHFPIARHFWERWGGAGRGPSPPPHAQFGARASPSPPQHLARPAALLGARRVAMSPARGMAGWLWSTEGGSAGRCRRRHPLDWRCRGRMPQLRRWRLPEGPRMSSGFTHDHLTAAAAALPTGTRGAKASRSRRRGKIWP